jgi:C_GCAxxG_C_C family probable redox protein
MYKISDKDEILNKVASAAEKYSKQGYHCSEGALRAICETLGIPVTNEVLMSVSGFRGGGGGMRERCGIVEVGITLIGLLYGRLDYTEPKEPYSELTRKLHEKFQKEVGSYNCRDLYPISLRLDGDCVYYYKKNSVIVADFLIDTLDEIHP